MRFRRAQAVLGFGQSIEDFRRSEMGEIHALGCLCQKGKELGRRHRHGRSAISQERPELRDICLAAANENRRRQRHGRQPGILAGEKETLEVWMRVGHDRHPRSALEPQT